MTLLSTHVALTPVDEIRSRSLIRWFLKIFAWALAAVGVAALVLTAMIATPLVAPPELHSVSAGRGHLDMSTLPRATARCSAFGTIRQSGQRPGAPPS